MASIDVEVKQDGTKRYVARYRTPGGATRKRRFARKADAQRFLTEVEHAKNSGGYVDASAGRVTFGAFAESWLEAQTFDVSTREAVERRLRVHMLPTFGALELRLVRPSTVQSWLRGRLEVCAASTVKVMLANLSTILGAAVEDGLIARNPCSSKSVRTPSAEREKVVPWESEQVLAVIATHPIEYRAIPAVAVGAGLRQGEVFGLRLGDVDFLRRELHVRQQIKIVGARVVVAPPKGGKQRSVPLADSVVAAVAQHLARYPVDGPDDLIFTGWGRRPIARTTYNDGTWKPALVRAGVEPTRRNGMHILRHTFASALLSGGESIRTVAEYLGHSDPGFTLRVYTHLMPTSAERSRRAIEEMLGGTPRVHSVSNGV